MKPSDYIDRVLSENFNRFKDSIGDTWDTPVETGEGNLTKEEERAIYDGGFYGKEISNETINLLNAGKPYSETKGGEFILRIYAPDGNYIHRHKTKEDLIKDAKGYGPGWKQGEYLWVDDDGRRFKLEGLTYAEIFGKDAGY